MVTIEVVAPVAPELSPEQKAFIHDCVRLDCEVIPPTIQRGNSLIRKVHAGKVWYMGIGAGCNCASLALFKFGDEGYTLCKHGLNSIGMLRRDRG